MTNGIGRAKLNSHIVTACIAVVVAFGTSWATGQGKPNSNLHPKWTGEVQHVVAAKTFLLIAEDGTTRGVWGTTDEKKQCHLEFRYGDGRSALTIYSNDGASRIELYDRDQNKRCLLNAMDDSGILRLRGKETSLHLSAGSEFSKISHSLVFDDDRTPHDLSSWVVWNRKVVDIPHK
jgi:hypothetical protein